MSSFNRFHPIHRELTDVEKTLVAKIKDKAEDLAEMIDQVGGREGAVALTNLEQTVMWAVKGVTK